ncbi:hypothetical protein [Williamsia muralis]|uniref:hypothetical protein n=1 Tax=Williamsia marianensis TaxID=85044 RepID=UPI000DE79E0C|nr:hypothetical protein [Williamsia marianensis]PVY30131.1 membrane protein [Williamsia marianensis]
MVDSTKSFSVGMPPLPRAGMLMNMIDTRNVLDRTRARLRTTARGRAAVRVVIEVLEIGVVDRAMTLAAQSFTSLVPVMIAIGTLGAMDPVSEALRSDYGLDLSELDGATEASATAFGVVGVFMLVISGTSYARALARTYGQIWSSAIPTYRQGWRWIIVILAVAAGAMAIGAARTLDDVPVVGPWLMVATQFAIWLLVWTGIPALLLPAGLPTRARWSTGALTALGLTVLQVASVVALPRIMNSAEKQFGVLGMVFTMIGWLFVYSAIVVISATVVHALTQDVDDDAPGRWLRGSPAP